jgi:hypothetical protein
MQCDLLIMMLTCIGSQILSNLQNAGRKPPVFVVFCLAVGIIHVLLGCGSFVWHMATYPEISEVLRILFSLSCYLCVCVCVCVCLFCIYFGIVRPKLGICIFTSSVIKICSFSYIRREGQVTQSV